MAKDKDHYVYFTGDSLQHIAAELDEAKDLPGAQMQVHGKGEQTFIRFVADGYHGDDTNNATQCPGRPGC